MRRPRREESGGFVLIAVLIVLLALLVLTAPFLDTARHADRAAHQASDRADVRLALDSASRHARASLGRSHPSVDPTPYHDSIEELTSLVDLPEAFLDHHDPSGTMWDVDLVDQAGLIDLDTASPMVIANLAGLVARLTEPVTARADLLFVSSLAPFDPTGGVVWVEGESIAYTGFASEDEGQALSGLTRGLGSTELEEGGFEGPIPPSGHGIGAHVIDQRAFTLNAWRTASADGLPRGLDQREQLRELQALVLQGAFSTTQLRAIDRFGSVHNDVAGGPLWQRSARLTQTVEPGDTWFLRVDSTQWFAPGSVIQIASEEGEELRWVQRNAGGGIAVDAPLELEHPAWETEVRVLCRRPVNLNTAPPEVLEALFEGLQIIGRNQRITGSEATELASLVVASRPFDGFGDFLARLVLPAAGIDELPADARARPAALEDDAEQAVIDVVDAIALYLNGLNANDGRLAFSTMPYTFTSNELYGMNLRAARNAESGVERAAGRRDRVELVVPQEPLFEMFARQEDFELAVRLDRESAWWMTGPRAVTRPDGTTTPPSRLIPHMGSLNGRPYVPGLNQTVVNEDGERIQPTRVQPSREDDAWAQLWPIRLPSGELWNGRTLNFDHETRQLEGRYLVDEPVVRQADDSVVQWSDTEGGGLAMGLHGSFWFRPRSLFDSRVLDVGGTSEDGDRISLLLEGEDLVLRVWDAFGDHPDSPEQEVTEARYALAQGDVPGLPGDTWTHLAVDVAGTRPDQLGLMVDGQVHGVRRLGMSRTTAGIDPSTTLIPLESVEGFPAEGVAWIGGELLEYVLDGNALRTEFQVAGPLAGFGGRFARLQHDVEVADPSLAVDFATGNVSGAYPAGTTVSVYGYSAPLASNVPAGGAQLPAELGPWRVARVADLGGGVTPEPILAGAGTVDWGVGIEGAMMPSLVLAQADLGTQSDDPGDVMEAFNRNGGYAALIQIRWRAGFDAEDALSQSGYPLGGVEIVRYSGWSGNELQLAARGDQVAGELQALGQDTQEVIGSTRVFIIDWRAGVQIDQVQIDTQLRAQTFCVPISLPAPGATDVDYLPPFGRSEFAQLTRTDAAELTEWVRYDEIQPQFGQLVRDDPAALLQLMESLTTTTGEEGTGQQPGPPGGPGGPGGGGGGGGGGGFIVPPEVPAAFVGSLAQALKSVLEPEPAARGTASQGTSAQGTGAGSAGPAWEPWLGQHEYADLPFTHAAHDAFHFRGVLGTHSHSHPAGTYVLPVWRMPNQPLERGRLGARDRVFLAGPDVDHPGWPLTVHRAHIPAAQRIVQRWDVTDDEGSLPASASSVTIPQIFLTEQYVAFTTPNPEPMTVGATPGVQGVTDTRLLARVSKWPSGERPRQISQVGLGGSVVNNGFGAGGTGEVPDALVDEVHFVTPAFGAGVGGSVPTSHTQAGALLLAEDMGASTLDMRVRPNAIRVPGGFAADAGNRLDALPEDAGLLRVGEEILCYEARDPDGGELTLAPLGRGLLGTGAQPHVVGEPVQWLEWIPVTVLAGALGPGDGAIPVASTSGFPAEGTLLIGSEVVHYTRTSGGAFLMPRRSSEPGRRDGEGDGLFRGRYGTGAQGHEAGTPVIWFPARYWDRHADRADAPEMSWFGLERHQPGAFFESFFFDTDPGIQAQAQIGVLLRTDPGVPWDADPDTTDGLDLFWRGREQGEALELDLQADSLEWRVFVRYLGGACDPTTGRAHGWKESPRLIRLGSTCTAPNLVLRSLDR